jgi:hypothetical protein
MSSETKITEQQLFDQLISSLVHSAWVFMGKIKNPINDKLERDLDQASIQIDMLDMLYNRMSGNLSDNEDQYLGHLIRELKMNFVEEKNKKTEENVEDGTGKMEGEEKTNKEEGKSKKEKSAEKTEKSHKVEETEEGNNEEKE